MWSNINPLDFCYKKTYVDDEGEQLWRGIKTEIHIFQSHSG